MVLGIPHEKWGETPVVTVILKERKRISEEELKDWIDARAEAKFQRVSAVTIMDDFPRNVAGQTLKREMLKSFGDG